MQIITGTLNGHTLRYANDNGDNFSEPDAWKFKIDNGAWSAPFDTFDAMLNAVDIAHTRTAHPGPYCDCDMCQSRMP